MQQRFEVAKQIHAFGHGIAQKRNAFALDKMQGQHAGRQIRTLRPRG